MSKTKTDKTQHLFNKTIIEDLANSKGTGNIPYYILVRERLNTLIKNNTRILIKTKETQYPQNCAVVTLTKTYPRFALGYVENRVTGVKIPYTLNYSIFSDRKAKVIIVEE